MRRSAGVLSSLFLLIAMCRSASPDAVLERGKVAFRAGDYAAAVIDLQAAAKGLGAAETTRLEEALVYLALSQSRLGRGDDALDTVQRLLAAERIVPSYEGLRIPERDEFEVLLLSLVPASSLPPTMQGAVEDGTAALPRVAAAVHPPAGEVAPSLPSVAPPAPVQRAIADLPEEARRAYVSRLQQADALANQGDLEAANVIYELLATTDAVPREILAAAATGLYRTGSYAGSAAGFRRLGGLAKGEEDLRYYHAVALFETGRYLEARRELACALPFIELTEDVSRYRSRIERTALPAGKK